MVGVFMGIRVRRDRNTRQDRQSVWYRRVFMHEE